VLNIAFLEVGQRQLMGAISPPARITPPVLILWGQDDAFLDLGLARASLGAARTVACRLLRLLATGCTWSSPRPSRRDPGLPRPEHVREYELLISPGV